MKLNKILKKNVFLIVALVFLLGFIVINANITGWSIYTFVDSSNISIPAEENITVPIIENITVPENLIIGAPNLTLRIEINETYGRLFGTLAATITTITLNSTLGTNSTNENLTVYTDQDTNASVKLIRNWYLNGTSITVLNMPFEGGSTNGAITPTNGTTRDYSGYGNNGTVVASTTNAGPTWCLTCGYDSKGSYMFDGINDYIQILNASTINNLHYNAFSAGAWIYPLTLGASNLSRILDKTGSTGGALNGGWSLRVNRNNSIIGWTTNVTESATNANALSQTTNLSFNLNQLNHIIMTYSHNRDSKVRIYLNGIT